MAAAKRYGSRLYLAGMDGKNLTQILAASVARTFAKLTAMLTSQEVAFDRMKSLAGEIAYRPAFERGATAIIKIIDDVHAARKEPVLDGKSLGAAQKQPERPGGAATRNGGAPDLKA